MNNYLINIIFLNVSDIESFDSVYHNNYLYISSGQIHFSICSEIDLSNDIKSRNYLNTTLFLNNIASDSVKKSLRTISCDYFLFTDCTFIFGKETIDYLVSSRINSNSYIFNCSVKRDGNFVNLYPELFNYSDVLLYDLSTNIVFKNNQFLRLFEEYDISNVLDVLNIFKNSDNINNCIINYDAYIYFPEFNFEKINITDIEHNVITREVIVPVDTDKIVDSFYYGRYGIDLLKKCIGAWLTYKSFCSKKSLLKFICSKLGKKFLGDNNYAQL